MMNQTILIVEDDDVTSYIIAQRLENMGFDNVLVANNHENALKAIARRTPDLILMDINLQGSVNGIELVKEIHSQIEEIPVIFVSGTIDLQEIREAKSVANSKYIYKPIDFKLFSQAVLEMVGKGVGV